MADIASFVVAVEVPACLVTVESAAIVVALRAGAGELAIEKPTMTVTVEQ
jgi:hypothetical protein